MKNKDYYLFGKEHENPDLITSTNRWGYNGKEKQTVKDLGWLDFMARMYANSEIPRFTTQDPMAEQYYSISPYAYCAGNPIRYIDPTGMYYYDWNNKIYRTDAGKEVSWDEIVQNNFVEPQKIKDISSFESMVDFMKQSSLWTIIEKGLIYDIDTKQLEEGTTWIEGMPTKLVKGGTLLVVSTKTGKYVDIMDSSLKREFDKTYEQQLTSEFQKNRFYWSPVSDDRPFQLLSSALASNVNPISIPLFGVAKDVNSAYNFYTDKLIEKRIMYYQKYNIIKHE
ncbi:MAG: RHS repeat-associated core domain-containing protein [Prevotellaceae bacterium]|jgi:RHS repeat-associated protein|nr:RHS repeat-associated core domain-containing protein [Prevotellaceae bacterium]